MHIPNKTDGMVKFIRTGEGLLVFAFNLALLIVPTVSNALSPQDAVKYAAILNGIAVVSRTGLKLASVVTQETGLTPDAPVSPQVSDDIDTTARDVVPQLIAALRAAPSSDQAMSALTGDIADIKRLVGDLHGAAVNGNGEPAPV
jgi:hypothetical protein